MELKKQYTTTGIAAMRIQVNMLGRFAFTIQFERLRSSILISGCVLSGFAFKVQIVINFCRECLTDTAYLHQVIDSSAPYTLQPPKLFQQFPAALWSQARDFLET